MVNEVKNFAYVILTVLIIASGTACEESVSPVLGTDEDFTLWGLFNPTVDIQAVRVFLIEGRLELEKPEPLQATVFSTDLNTGEQLEWVDSLVQYPSRRYGHVFWAPFRAEYEHDYQLRIQSEGGVLAHVTVEVPPFSEAEVLEVDTQQHELITPVLWRRAPNLINILLRYGSNAGTVEVEYGIEQETTEEGQLVYVRFREDTRIIFDLARLNGIDRVILGYVEMEVMVTNKEWVPPGGVFDAEVFVEPRTFSNVVDGFGFVGAGYRAKNRWLPPNGVLRAAGFYVAAN